MACRPRIGEITRCPRAIQRDGIQDPQAAQEINPATGLPTGRRTGRHVPICTEVPTRRLVEHTNRRTGEVRRVDAGLHPAWANNPGRQRAAVLRLKLSERLAQADNPIAVQTYAR